MMTKTTTASVSDQQIIIGDILLHLESKIITIPIAIHSCSARTTKVEQPHIQRLSSNINSTQAIVPCDLKNSSPTNSTNERMKTSSLSSKKLLRMPKVGLALAKEFKSKVVTSRMHTTSDDKQQTDDEQTKL